MRVPYRRACPPGTPHTGGPRASQGRNSTAWGGSWRPLLAGGTRYRKCPVQALITLTSSTTFSKNGVYTPTFMIVLVDTIDKDLNSSPTPSLADAFQFFGAPQGGL